MGKSGFTAVQKFQHSGLEARANTVTTVAISDISFAPEGHVLQHPREHTPIDDVLVRDIVDSKAIHETATVMQDGFTEDGKIRLLVIDGARRIVNGLVAERILNEQGMRDAKTGGPFKLFLKVKLFSGSFLDALYERARANTDPLKVPDSFSVLAVMYRAMMANGGTIEDVVSVAPKGIGPAEVQALLRWFDLVPEVAARFDKGEAPIGLLTAVLDAGKDKQAETLDSLLAKGVKSTRGATRAKNREAKEKDGSAPAERPHPAKLRKALSAIEERIDLSDYENGVRDCLRYALGLILVESLPKEAQQILLVQQTA